jgi:hypothetical protein
MFMPCIGKGHAKMGKRTGKMHIAITKKRKTMPCFLCLNRGCNHIIGFHQNALHK